MFNLSNLLASLVGIAMAISIHEFGHAYSAHLLGDDTAKYNGRMTLNPAKHIDPLGLIILFICHFGWAKPVPVNPNNFKNYKVGNLIVSISGVIGNLIGAIICALILKYFDMYAIQKIFGQAMWINIGFGAFNLYKFNDVIYKYENVGYAVLLISIFTGIYSYVTTPIMMAFYYVVSIFM